MATYYVSSVDGNDADNGTTWALAKATVAGALAVATANGDIIYVDSAHAFSSGGSITWDAATSGTAISIISVNRNGSTTTGHSGWLAGAKETVGVNAASFLIATARAQKIFFWGLYIEGNNGAGANAYQIGQTTNGASDLWFENCTISSPGSASTSPEIAIGTTASARFTVVTFKSCTIIGHSSANAAAAFISIQCADVRMINVTLQYAGANKPPIFIRSNSISSIFMLEIIDSDLSGYTTSAGTSCELGNKTTAQILLRNCKLSSTPSIHSGTWVTNNRASIMLINVDSGDTKTVFEFRNRAGTLTENQSIYANNGAQMNGTGLSWEIVTTSACNEFEPFVTPWCHAWGDSTSAQNAGFRLIHDSATNLHNRNCWAEVEYVSDASFPKGTLGSTRNAAPFDGSSADLSSDSETWTGTGGFSNANKQKVDLNFTPAEKSLLRGRLSVGVASKTLYVAPQLWLS